MAAVEECIQALGNVTILSKKEEKLVLWFLQEEFEFSGRSRIDWKLYPHRITIYSPARTRNTPAKISTIFKKRGYKPSEEEIYIIWAEASKPVIKCTLQQALDHFDDIRIDFEAWLYSPEKHYVIEDYYMGETNILFL